MQIHHLWQAKTDGRPLVALTASDFAIATLLDAAGIDLILVGDSLAMTTLGYATTLPLTLDALIHHCAAVRRGVKQAFLVADLPFMTYQVSPAQALVSAGRVLQEAGANAVKLEGGYPNMVTTVATLVEAGIPVMGHIGLTPQAVHQIGWRQQGQSEAAAAQLQAQAQALEAAGAFAIVLEHIPADLAASISRSLTIPTLGIGAGQACDGQILVTHDLLGLSERLPPFAKAYLNLREQIVTAVQTFAADVRKHTF